MVGPHKSFFLARTQMISKGGRDMVWRFCLQHVLAFDIMRELGWANVLGNGVPKQLQKGQRGSLAHVHYSCQIRKYTNSPDNAQAYLVHPAGSTACADASCAGPLLSLLRVDPEHANGGW